MFKTAAPEEIGRYLDDLIKAKYGERKRKEFCGDYLELQGSEADDTQGTEDRFAKIINGSRKLQSYDLLTISELLGVSCEEILTAGKFKVPSCNHVTNRDIALSDNPVIWKRYMKQQMFLNADEYNKSVVDYAFEFRNIMFFKFLIEERYLWLNVDEGYETPSYRDWFEIRTTIKKINGMEYYHNYEYSLDLNDKLRTRIVLLAIETGNTDVLDLMHARETYETNWLAKNYKYILYSSNDEIIETVNKSVALSENEAVLSYFSSEYSIADEEKEEAEDEEVFENEVESEEFETETEYDDEIEDESVEEERIKEENLLIYPFLGFITGEMINNERYDKAEAYLRSIIDHNQKVYTKVTEFINDEVNNQLEEIKIKKEEDMLWCYSNGMSFEKYGMTYESETEIRKRVCRCIKYDIDDHMVICFDRRNNRVMVFNIISMENVKSSSHITELIDTLNDWYNKIISLKTEW